MAKYAKFLILVILVMIICLALIWYVFIKPNNEITEYMDKFENNTQAVYKEVEQMPQEKQLDNVEDVSNDGTNVDDEQQPGKQEENMQVPTKDPANVILTSETEMLNKQGEKLLKQISEELEKSIITIKGSTGVVNDEFLNNDNDTDI